MRPQIRSIALGLVLVSVSVLAGCGGGSSKPTPGAACVLNSDCASGLICTFGLCHGQCKVNGDCAAGSLCVKSSAVGDGGTINVCQLQTESKCVYNSQCQLPLICARDEQCRNQCQTSVDCVSPQVCTASKVCALQSQLVPGTDDVVLKTPDGGVAGSPGTGGAGGTAGGAAGAAGGAAGAAGAGPGTGGAAGGGGGVAGSAGGHAGAGTGGAAGAGGGCGSGCGVGMQCVSGTCMSCGHSGEVCCSGICGANLTCSTTTSMCTCGSAGDPCCGGTTCSSGLACVNGTCACGGAGQTCCPNKTCSNTSLLCGGLRCGCTKGCDQYSSWKSDGSIWVSGAPYSNLDGSAFKAINYSYNGTFTCGVKSGGTVWCWGSNSYGALGNGDTTVTSSTYPLQVVMDTSGTALTGITSVVVADTGYTACAIGAAGAVYCWGYGTQGQLGNGVAGNSPYAKAVMADTTTPFTGASQLALGYQHTCAVKTDHSLWCWGDNSQGQIGIGSTTATTVLNPAQVTTLMKNVTSVIATYGLGYNTCASTNDGKAYCWGYNAYGATGDGTFTSGSAPVRVPGNSVMVDASTALTNVVQVLDWGLSDKLCALKTDGTIWCWGYNTAGSYAAPLLDNTQTPVSGITIVGRSCYLDNADLFWYNGGKSSYQQTCN